MTATFIQATRASEMTSDTFKQYVYRIPGAREILRVIKAKYRAGYYIKFLRKRCYQYDMETDRKYLGWQRSEAHYWKLSSELIFWYHKLEKGLCLPSGARPWFGKEAAERTLQLMVEWDRYTFDKKAPIYQAALEVLRAYRERMSKAADDNLDRLSLLEEIRIALSENEINAGFATPILSMPAPLNSYEVLRELSLSRRSSRNFTSEKVEMDLVERAISIAQLSPSACNRQPWKLHFYESKEDISKMLALQNGNSGFGHTVPLLVVICCDLNGFFDSSERIEPILDGGLFLMSFLLALQSLGLSSCCLNWCVDPERDKLGHAVGSIPPQEKILTFLAIGHIAPDAVVPLSARRPLSDIIQKH